MNTLPLSFPETLGRALGWMVLHSLWQATLVGIAAAVLLLIFRQKPAYIRYWIANGALAAVLIGAVCTLCYCIQEPSTNPLPNQIEVAPTLLEKVTFDAKSPDPSLNLAEKSSLDNTALMNTYFERHLPLIVTLWFLGMGLFLLRLLGNMGYLHYLKTRMNFTADAYWVELLDNLNQRVGSSKTIRLVESALVRTPMVAGYLKPVILFPIGMINRLETKEVEAILAHELAHIIRRDYLFNILQSAVETLFYYHPAVWWLSARARHEREMAADDIAIALTGNAVEYAKALVTVQDMAFFPLSPSLAFAGIRKSHLLIRVQHILNIKQSKNLAMEKLIGTCAILLVLFGLSYAQNTSSLGNSPQSAQTAHFNDAHSGIWEGKIENDRVCMTLSNRSENSMWMNNECFAKTEFSALPQQEGEFTLTRAAGTMTFKGKFEGNEGYGRFTFRTDDSFRDWLKQQGVTGVNDGILVHLFLANCDKDYVAFLKQKMRIMG